MRGVTLQPEVGAPALRVVTELIGRRSARVIGVAAVDVDETVAMARLCLGGREPDNVDAQAV